MKSSTSELGLLIKVSHLLQAFRICQVSSPALFEVWQNEHHEFSNQENVSLE